MRVDDFLMDIGVPAHIAGFEVAEKAVQLCMEDPLYLKQVTTRLYPTIAEQLGCTGGMVERRLRHAIEWAFDRSCNEFARSIFRNTISERTGKPTNAQFIATIVKYLQRDPGSV